MNTEMAERPAIQEFLFGDALLHTRFSCAIDLLGRLIMANPGALTAAALAEASGQPVRNVRSLLANLQAFGLVHPDTRQKDAWYCSVNSGSLTLADVFRSVAAVKPESSAPRKLASQDAAHAAARIGVDLLLMQATMAINQVVLQHLQSFDLGKLKAVSTRDTYRVPASRTRAYVAEPL
ncbi:hypothetical protein [Noviherbaspirillum saxi]|uniref:Uncharacterized protein n=1 Tax=Noviherbaspirillum saxi TaxID=2320863 RepID=A0A3A3FNF4_9BURK|nr:hypothetical protein [Noviherbaspirillum saxi]RJF97737.1 hypothetical protein D3871_03775 [Noviherbaspirillum saxi]